ncbi:type II toxin-antitoxin system RelE/ParE family toxin [Roseateles sp.]|uniref:type II toxin-antitoxin system RelE family toxin n=1 Tax=Roseateles sp. TaxID=1971397 RepID=UPI0031DBA113
MNRINWTEKAMRQMLRLPREAVKAIAGAVLLELADLKNARNVKRLFNHPYAYRLRVGDYRVFFDLAVEVRIVSIEEVRKRDEQTY